MKNTIILISVYVLFATTISNGNGLIANSGFETNEPIGGGWPTTFGDWNGDYALTVGETDGIIPLEGSQMLQFCGASFNGSGSASSCNVVTLVDVSSYSEVIATGNAMVIVSSFFNRINGDAQTDTEFIIDIYALSGSPASYPNQAENSLWLLKKINEIISDNDPETWERCEINATLPVGTDYLAIWVSAAENVFNDTSAPEFDGHFADEISLIITSEPYTFEILSPNGDEIIQRNSQYEITWNSSGIIETVILEYSTDNGQNWQPIATVPNTGSFEWNIPDINSNQCLVRASHSLYPSVNDASNSVFAIFECQDELVSDLNHDCYVDLRDFVIFCHQWLECQNPFDPLCEVEIPVDPMPMVWVEINDPGVSGHEGFNGQMSKYETTNAQYCQFLNAALASGDITISGSDVYGASGSNSGADFVGQAYYNLAGTGWTGNGATNGGAARINHSEGVFTVDSGFESHSVTYVSWYGATAFCNYYGYRLPTEWEWQAVADYNGSFTYGCGTTINNSKANYKNSTHPYGTTVGGAFGTYGYGMCDMAGNLWEWTSTGWESDRVLRGGCWASDGNLCLVSHRFSYLPGYAPDYGGFRVCR